MGFVNKYPYVDFHELNADALIAKVDDASAEAKAAAETVTTYNDRLTTVEGDLAPIKTAMPGIASSISDLTSGLGRVSSQVTTNTQDIADNAANIDNIEDRLTTYDQNFVNINNTFISDERRIGELEEYRTEAQVKIGNLGYSVAPLFDENAAYSTGDYVMSPTLKLHRAIADIPAGTANINDLTQFMPTDINNALGEGVLPAVTSADAGKTFVVNANGELVLANGGGVKHEMTVNSQLFEKLDGYYIDCGEYYIVRIKVRAIQPISPNDNIFTDGPVVSVAPYFYGLNLASYATHLMYISISNPGYINSFSSATIGNVIDCTSVIVK